MTRAAPLPFPWPRAEPAAPLVATAADQGPLARLDPPALAAALAPELNRLFALEVLPDAGPASSATPARAVRVARLPVTATPGEPVHWIALAIDPATAGAALSRLYGAPGSVADGEPALPAGVAGTAAWLSFARLLAMALARALQLLGVAPAGAPAVVARPVVDDPDPAALALALDLGGTRLALLLTADPAPVAPAAAAPAAATAAAADAGFAARARARVLDITLPVTLRLAGWRLPVARVAGLKAGDVLPIEAPWHLDLMVGGRRIARLPAEDIVGQRSISDDVVGRRSISDDDIWRGPPAAAAGSPDSGFGLQEDA